DRCPSSTSRASARRATRGRRAARDSATRWAGCRANRGPSRARTEADRLGSPDGARGFSPTMAWYGDMRQPAAPSSSFWDDVGAHFPSLKGTVSTAYYFECERWLFETYFPPLRNLRIFKTDLWDEAKNTEILRWAADRGAGPVGIDVSIDVVRDAGKVLGDH